VFYSMFMVCTVFTGVYVVRRVLRRGIDRFKHSIIYL